MGGPEDVGVKKQRPESHPRAGARQPELAEWGEGCPWVVPGHQPWQMPCLEPRFSIRPLPGFLPSRPLPHPSSGLSGLDLFIQMDQEVGPA